MTPEVFDDLLSYIEIDITKQIRVLREPIPTKMKLAGNSLLFIYWNESHLQHIFCVHRSATGQFIPKVYDATYQRLKDKYLKVRNNKLK